MLMPLKLSHIINLSHKFSQTLKVAASHIIIDVGVCLGGSGVTESVFLNQKPGIRAALVHTKYLAEMCRKVSDV